MRRRWIVTGYDTFGERITEPFVRRYWLRRSAEHEARQMRRLGTLRVPSIVDGKPTGPLVPLVTYRVEEVPRG